METGERKKILVIEDQVVNRRVIGKILSDTYDVCEAQNGQEAIDILEQDGSVTAVLLDIIMPVLDGYGVLEYLNTVRGGSLPVIVMTGENDATQELKALNSGAWDFVAKPIQAMVLKTRLRNAIARSENALMEQIRYDAEHDKLTGLYNRSKFYQETRKLLDSHPETTFVFVKFDIDRFDTFNTDYGEEAGDDLIRAVANALVRQMKGCELCTYGRMDADVFCACIPHDEKRLWETVEAASSSLGNYRKDCLLKPSFGAYVISDPEITVQRMYMRASMAIKACKNQFSVCLNYYTKEQGAKSREETEITNEMQHALEEEQFVVYFQPKFKLVDDISYGAEALVRWKHPVKGLLSPGKFVPLFERNGFIARLDYYVWEKSCQFLRKWMDAGCEVFPISVNVSRVCMYDPNLVEKLLELIQRYDIPISMLNLEVTESEYMTNPDLMQKTIDRLRREGFILMMDDFGCGYSSLNTLKDIEVDVLKIDMKFLPMDGNRKKAEIILASIIRMTRWLGLTVVVEGVETIEQKEFLLGVGCDYVQGYYYAKPMPSEVYEKDYIIERKSRKEREIYLDEGEGGIVVIVDDDAMSRDILRTCFEEDYQVCLCESAEEAMACLKVYASRTQLIILDNILPGLSGLDLLEYYRNDPVVSLIPKMMITVSDMVEDQMEAFRLGVQEFIQKPLDKKIILTRTRHVMEVHNRMQSFIEQQEKYQNLVIRDKATSLLNKTSFIEKCEETLNYPVKGTHALILLDIDDFKNVNDTYGHLEGDRVIKVVAQELQKAFRSQDVIGRFGGDEFVVMMTNIPSENIARKKLDILMKNVKYECARTLHIYIGISIGVSFYEQEDRFEQLFSRADQALYDAKVRGKGCVTEYGSVPAVTDDTKPIVLVCSSDSSNYPEIAFSYGDGAAFVYVSSCCKLQETFEKYGDRVQAVCLDIRDKRKEDSGEFYQYMTEWGVGVEIPLLAVCEEGSMNQVREALKLNICDIIALPAQREEVRRKLSRALATSEVEREEKES